MTPAYSTIANDSDPNTPLSARTDFTDMWKERIDEVDAAMRERLDGLGDRCPTRLREAMRYSLLAPGKRLRPILSLLACEGIGSDRRRAMPCAMALEMVHCYSLIHDDLPAMDDDDLRRGRPTCHIQFDEATAILAGDALQALAFETMATSTLEPNIALACCATLAKAVGPEGMVGGQMDDLLAETQGGDADVLHAIHSRKTGALIRASVLLGGLAGNGSQEQLEILAQFGEAIGIAFQIVDDLLDVESTAENTGKRTGKDHERGKLTFPAIYGIQASRDRAEQLVEHAIATISRLGPDSRALQLLAKFITDRSN